MVWLDRVIDPGSFDPVIAPGSWSVSGTETRRWIGIRTFGF